MLLCRVEDTSALKAALASLQRCDDPAKTLVRFQGQVWLKALIAKEQSNAKSLRWLHENYPHCGWVDAKTFGDSFKCESAILTRTLDADEELEEELAALHDPVDDAKVVKRYEILLSLARRLGVISVIEVGQLNGFVDGNVIRLDGRLQCVPAPDKCEGDRRDTMRHMLAFAVIPALSACRIELSGLARSELNGKRGLLIDVPTRFEGRVGVVRSGDSTRLLQAHIDNIIPPAFLWNSLSFTYTLLHTSGAPVEERVKAQIHASFHDGEDGRHASLAMDPEEMPPLWDNKDRGGRALAKWFRSMVKKPGRRREVKQAPPSNALPRRFSEDRRIFCRVQVRLRVSVTRTDTNQSVTLLEGPPTDGEAVDEAGFVDFGWFPLASAIPLPASDGPEPVYDFCRLRNVHVAAQLHEETGQVSLEFCTRAEDNELLDMSQSELDTFFDEGVRWLPIESHLTSVSGSLQEALPAVSTSMLVQGCSVRIVGLRSRPALNGSDATVLHRSRERWAVRVSLTQESILLKPENLELITTPPPWEMLEAGVLVALGVHGTAVAAQVCTSWRRAALAALDSWRKLRLLRSVLTEGGGVVGSIPQPADVGSLLALGRGSTLTLARVCDTTIVQQVNGTSQTVIIGNPPPPLDPSNIARTVQIGGRTCYQMKRRPLPREALGDLTDLSGIVYAGGSIYTAEDSGCRLQRFRQRGLDGVWEAIALIGRDEESPFQHRGLVLLEDLLFTCDISNNRVVGTDLALTRRAVIIGSDADDAEAGNPPLGSFCEPQSLATTGGLLYVLDCVRIQAFKADGTLVHSFDHAAGPFQPRALCAGPFTSLYVLEDNEKRNDDLRLQTLSCRGAKLQDPIALAQELNSSSSSSASRSIVESDMCVLDGLLYVSTTSFGASGKLYVFSTFQPHTLVWSDFCFHVTLQYKSNTRASWKGSTLEPDALGWPASAPVLWDRTPKWWKKAKHDVSLRVKVIRRAPDGSELASALLYEADVDLMSPIMATLGVEAQAKEAGCVDFQSRFLGRPTSASDDESSRNDDSDEGEDFGGCHKFRMVASQGRTRPSAHEVFECLALLLVSCATGRDPRPQGHGDATVLQSLRALRRHGPSLCGTRQPGRTDEIHRVGTGLVVISPSLLGLTRQAWMREPCTGCSEHVKMRVQMRDRQGAGAGTGTGTGRRWRAGERGRQWLRGPVSRVGSIGNTLCDAPCPSQRLVRVDCFVYHTACNIRE